MTKKGHELGGVLRLRKFAGIRPLVQYLGITLNLISC